MHAFKRFNVHLLFLGVAVLIAGLGAGALIPSAPP